MCSQLIKDGLRHHKARRRPLQVSLYHFLSRNRFGYVVPALNWAGGCSCSILQFNYQAYVLLLDIHFNTEPCPCAQWFILQAYEKEDEAPAAAPAGKKEKVAEKVVRTISQIRILTIGPCFRSDTPGRTSPRRRAFHDMNELLDRESDGRGEADYGQDTNVTLCDLNSIKSPFTQTPFLNPVNR